MEKENEDDNTKNQCRMHASDIHGDPNLCCCYYIDAEGNLGDPCHYPVNDCCRDPASSV